MNTSDDSGFEEDCDNNLLIDPVKSCSSSSGSLGVQDSKKEEIIPFIPLVQSGISLEPDMLFGWRPKNLLNKGPIPLSFSMISIPSKNSIYHGYRPEDSLELHEEFSGPMTYSYIINPSVRHAYNIVKKSMPKKESRSFVGMKPDLCDENLEFNSKFEGGNLDKVAKVAQTEYDLYLRNDSNTFGKNQWFFFEAKNKGEAFGAKFNIVNFSKQDCLYNQGQQPFVFRESFPGKGWHFMSEDAKYTFSKVNKTLISKKMFYCLSFSFTFPAGETIKFAYTIPYSYSDLLKYLNELQGSRFVKRESLCKSLSGVDVPLLTITDEDCSRRKEPAIITARVHPGETNGSWAMQGFLNFITGNSAAAARLRNCCVFKIVPMLNPDGVIVGNSRCSLNGQDLNRQFHVPDERLHPEIYHLKNLIFKTKGILTYLDFHSHSKKKGMFIYGPYFPLHSKHHCEIRVIPKLLSENTEMFRYYSCKFRNDWSKRKAARLVISREHALPFSYTFEISSFGYLDTERNTIPFNIPNLLEIGHYILKTLLQFIDLRDEEIQMRRLRTEQRQRKTIRNSPAKELENKRTMGDILEQIKNDLVNEDNSDSGGSNSDGEKDEEEDQANKKILSLLKQVDRIASNPSVVKRYSQSQGSKMPKLIKKPEDVEVPTKSTLAKYFSRASTSNTNKLKSRAESVKRAIESEKKSIQKPSSRPSQIISKFSYSRGLYALKPRAVHFMFEHSVLKNKKSTLRSDQRETSNPKLGIFLDCLDRGYESNTEGESPKKTFDLSAMIRKNARPFAEDAQLQDRLR